MFSLSPTWQSAWYSINPCKHFRKHQAVFCLSIFDINRGMQPGYYSNTHAFKRASAARLFLISFNHCLEIVRPGYLMRLSFGKIWIKRLTGKKWRIK
jgi:hypothetical protein